MTASGCASTVDRHYVHRSGSFTSYASASEQQLFRSAASSVVSAATTPRQRGSEVDASKADPCMGGVDWAAAAAAAMRTAEARAGSPKQQQSVSPSPPSPPAKQQQSVSAPPPPSLPKQPSAPPATAYPSLVEPAPAAAQPSLVANGVQAVGSVPASAVTMPTLSALPTKQPPTSPTNTKLRSSWVAPPTAPHIADSAANTPRIGAHMPSWLAVPPAPVAEPSAFSPLANGAPTVHQRLATPPPVSPKQLADWEMAEHQQLAAVLLEEEAALHELGLSTSAHVSGKRDKGLRASWHHFGQEHVSRGVLGLSMDAGWDRKVAPVALMPPVKNMWGLR